MKSKSGKQSTQVIALSQYLPAIDQLKPNNKLKINLQTYFNPLKQLSIYDQKSKEEEERIAGLIP